MLTVKNGLKSILRTPWKSVLFSAVLILLSALLTVSLCVFFAVQGYLSDCDDYYHTIANLEYVGADYPKSSVYDGELAKAVAQHREELDALLRSDSVISYEAESNTVALAEGLHRSDADVLEPSSAVLRLKNVMYDERLDIYLMQVEESLYSCECYDGTVLFVRTARMPCDGGEKLENGRDYYAVGRFYKGQTANPWFFAEETSFREAGQTVTLPPFTAERKQPRLTVNAPTSSGRSTTACGCITPPRWRIIPPSTSRPSLSQKADSLPGRNTTPGRGFASFPSAPPDSSAWTWGTGSI